MKTNILSLSLCLLVGIALSCAWSGCGDGCASSKEGFLEDYYTFIDKVSRNPPSNTDEWAKQDDQLRKYIRVCYPKYQDKITVIEQGQFWWSGLNYFYARYGKDVVNMATNDILLAEVKKQLIDLGKNFDETVNQISDTWNSVVNGVQDRWRDIKNLFQ